MKVGVFDSGSGGLTILQSLVQTTPYYDYIYLGDYLHNPYGDLTFEQTLKYVKEAVHYLFSQHCQIIIMACNTASSRILRSLQQSYLPLFQSIDKRILGVVRPATEKISQLQTTDFIAIWGTSGTIYSKSYEIEINTMAPNLKLVTQSCPSLASLIEQNNIPEILESIEYYWEQTQIKIDYQPISTLLLACTHYPLIMEHIQKIISLPINIIDQRYLIKEKWLYYLKKHSVLEQKLSKNHSIQFQTTKKNLQFDSIINKLFNVSHITQEVSYGNF